MSCNSNNSNNSNNIDSNNSNNIDSIDTFANAMVSPLRESPDRSGYSIINSSSSDNIINASNDTYYRVGMCLERPTR